MEMDMKTESAIDKKLETLGLAVYGSTWPQVLAKNVYRVTAGGGRALTVEEKQHLIRGLEILKQHGNY